MNKTRILGIVLMVLGIAIQFILENEVIDFLSGLLIGVGIGFLLNGRIGRKANNNTNS
jgi:hypothetical protein